MRRRQLRGALLATAATVALLAACGRDATPPGSSSPVSDGALRWTSVPQAPLRARHEADGVWVGGRFVVFGGHAGPACPDTASCAAPADPALRDGAAFDPATGRWTAIAPAPVPISSLSAVVAGGRIFLLTGEPARADSPSRFLGYDPDKDAWTAYAYPPQPGQLVPVADSVAVIPNSDEQTESVDAVFDRDRNRWRVLPDDPLGPSFDREAVAVPGGLLLAAKDLVDNPGSGKPAVVRLARLDLHQGPGRSAWKLLADSEIIGWGPVPVGKLVVWPVLGSADGGEVNGWGRSYPEGGIYDPAASVWRPLPALPGHSDGMWCCSGAVLGDRVLAAGWILDPAARRWQSLPALPGGRRSAAAVVSGPDAVLVWGGATSGNQPENLSDGYLLRP